MLGNSARAAGVGTRFVLLVGYMGGQNAEAEVRKRKYMKTVVRKWATSRLSVFNALLTDAGMCMLKLCSQKVIIFLQCESRILGSKDHR